YVLLAAVTWYFLQADLSVTKELSAGWIGMMLLRNMILIWVIFGFYHFTLYMKKTQGTKGKYNPNWQEKGKKKFLFKNQVLDNIFFTCVSGAPIWTAANGLAPLASWASNPVGYVHASGGTYWILKLPSHSFYCALPPHTFFL
ncbi:MAG: hypothetical protein KAH21_06030, partial [Spirochaetaceae bacterium]|nr:hypothetical protein [Spirochaetaceae bacterium]